MDPFVLLFLINTIYQIFHFNSECLEMRSEYFPTAFKKSSEFSLLVYSFPNSRRSLRFHERGRASWPEVYSLGTLEGSV